jgi:signal transduction histidine kinase
MTVTLLSIAAEIDHQDNSSHLSHSRKTAAPEGTMLPSPPTGSDRQYTSCNLLHAQKMATLGELASGITHDFRNILQTVISTLDAIESRSDDSAEVRRLTASALRASERGIGLTKRLLKFSRFEAADARPICLLVSLENATETLVRTVEARMNVGIEPLPADLWPVIIDPTEFELALINLGINARDAMPHGGRIRLGARNVRIPHVDRRTAQLPMRHDQTDHRGPRLPLPGGDYVMVTVDDTGHGMDAATLARAIEPFFTTKPLDKGTGLGLSTAHSLTSHAQGALRLISKLGQGTTVQLWLPRAPASIGSK